jgi:CBS-domain-containing membrane protein
MTPDVRYCFEDEDTEHVARNMADQQVRRLPVVNRDKRLVGIVSLGDLAISEGPRPAGEALSGISRPGGGHSQTGGSRT